MSALLSIIVRPAVSMRPGAFARRLSAACHRIAGYFDRRAAIATLREFDDGALQDIGLARSQIESAVRGLIARPERALRG